MFNLFMLCLSLLIQPGQVKRVIDGDTFILYSVGVTDEERVRVLRVDAVELSDSLGPRARSFTQQWLARGPFTVNGCRRDSFGRILADVTRGTDTLSVQLVNAGLGVTR
jgi:endonuclease YncB( thermonuclease family)